ncbi:MAG TPA: YtxH domain-containing protein [Candidatus Krumholzibacteria bacterium]|nr:YtxH domain-containing protein [Candidatus Krumholzibacteria bacterium]HPD70581.1 YtxH domain-containing protein [Candidatus Krumholzibacteria bacterium]HRY39719.1 YtxH domain-containing protein [Candidatus Krumholzibacteria bacterium]
MSKATNTALAFLLGVVTGGVVALLVAPDKGSETRRKIREGAASQAGRMKDWVDLKADEAEERARNLADKARNTVSGVAGGAKDQIDALRSAVAEGKDAYKRELDKGKSS